MTTRHTTGWVSALLALSVLGLSHGVFAQDQGHAHVIDGVAVYLGVIPAELISEEYPKQAPEHQMHGGVPSGDHWHHVNVAIYNDTTGQRITNARVVAQVWSQEEVNLPIQKKPLEPMSIAGAETYGNYFHMPGTAMYFIKVEIDRPGHTPIVTTFEYYHRS